AAVGKELQAAMKSSDGKPSRGHLFIALDPTAFGEQSMQLPRAKRFIEEIRGSRRPPGVHEIRHPGERGAPAHRLALERGVELPDPVWERMATVAQMLGLSAPALMS